MAARGLKGIMNKAVSRQFFKGFRLNDHIDYNLLQFANDTLIVGEASWDNLWKMKALLRGFQMVSILSVNMSKSKLYGVGIKEQFMQIASIFLNCKTDVLPFKFLGIVVGTNPRRVEAWDTVVNQMRRKLASWKGRHLSIGGRVTSVNSILCNMSIYSLSFYKALVRVIHTIRSIQRQFIWQGCEEKVGITWVSWKSMCREKLQGGLGIKDVGAFNNALLGKWKWKVLYDNDALWSNLLRFRYGNLQLSWLRKKDRRSRNKKSFWLRDLGLVGKRRGSE